MADEPVVREWRCEEADGTVVHQWTTAYESHNGHVRCEEVKEGE